MRVALSVIPNVYGALMAARRECQLLHQIRIKCQSSVNYF